MLGLLLSVLGPTDEELVRRFKEGDREAFSEIVLRYQDRVYSLCQRWLGDPATAEEVAQDVFLALFRTLADFRGEARLSTWIFRVATNHCRNRKVYRHRRAWDRHDPLDAETDMDFPARQIASQEPGTDRPLQRSEAGELLQQALSQLDETQRSIILLRDVEDLSYEEIAEILALPRGTVKSRLHRARAELARLLHRVIGPRDVFDQD